MTTRIVTWYGPLTKIVSHMGGAVEIGCFRHGHVDERPVNLERVRSVPSAAVSFLVKFGSAISRACGKKVRHRAVFPASPSVKVWFLTVNLPSSGSHM